MKKVYLLAIVGIVVVAAGVYVFMWRSNTPVNLNHVEEIHLRLDPVDIPELKIIIRNHPDNYVRERAVLVLSDIAIRKNVTNDAVGFLKDVAYNEKNDQVRSAAYSSINQIREFYPLAVQAGFAVKMDGAIIQGETITLVVICDCGRSVDEATVGINHIIEKEVGATNGIRLASPNPVRFPLQAGEGKNARFEMELRNEGDYRILCSLKLGFGRIDYLTLEKEIHLRVEKTGGSYEVLD
jgi:hypothetical protein